MKSPKAEISMRCSSGAVPFKFAAVLIRANACHSRTGHLLMRPKYPAGTAPLNLRIQMAGEGDSTLTSTWVCAHIL